MVPGKRRLACEDRVLRKLAGELREQRAGAVELILALGGEREESLGERLQISATLGRHLQLLHASLAVAGDASEPQKEALVAGETADDVVGRAERDVGVMGVGIDGEQPLGLLLGATDVSKGRQLALLDHGLEVPLHSV